MATRSVIRATLIAASFAAAPGVLAAEASLICLNGGNQYKVGDYACLPGCHGRQRYARCDAVSETASWTYISDVCPMALISPELPRGATVVPVVTAMSPIPYVVNMSAIAPEIEPLIVAQH